MNANKKRRRRTARLVAKWLFVHPACGISGHGQVGSGSKELLDGLKERMSGRFLFVVMKAGIGGLSAKSRHLMQT